MNEMLVFDRDTIDLLPNIDHVDRSAFADDFIITNGFYRYGVPDLYLDFDKIPDTVSQASKEKLMADIKERLIKESAHFVTNAIDKIPSKERLTFGKFVCPKIFTYRLGVAVYLFSSLTASEEADYVKCLKNIELIYGDIEHEYVCCIFNVIFNYH